MAGLFIVSYGYVDLYRYVVSNFAPSAVSVAEQRGDAPRPLVMRSDGAYSARIDAAAGATAGVVTDVIFYALDSYKILRQNDQPIRPANLFRGVLPNVLMGSATSFGVFFGVYNVVKREMETVPWASEGSVVLTASIVAGVPSSLIAVPADIVKKRMVLHGQTAVECCSLLYRSFGVGGFFIGWQANLAKDIPFIALKMTLYEGMARAYLHLEGGPRKRCGADSLSGREAAGIGFASGLATAVCTSPLDTINTRLKSGRLARDTGLLAAGRHVWATEGFRALFRGLAARALIVSCGSTFFWSFYASCRGRLHELL